MIVVVVISVVPQHNGDDFCLLLNDENEYDDVDDVGLLLSDLFILFLVSGDEGRRRLVPYYVVVSFEIDWNCQGDI